MKLMSNDAPQNETIFISRYQRIELNWIKSAMILSAFENRLTAGLV